MALLIENYNYPLPDERIAKYPLAQRDHSKLLIAQHDQTTTKGTANHDQTTDAGVTIAEDKFYNVGKYIAPGSLLVYNNTRVIQARLVFHKTSGARIEIFCLEPLNPSDYALSLGSTNGCTWKCMIGNLKKWKEGQLSLQVGDIILSAERIATMGNTHEVRFSWSPSNENQSASETQNETNSSLSFAEILDAMGQLPIPPYLNRDTEESDKTTYQTVYSRIKGSVAAPTAGLHFTDSVLDGLRQQGIRTTELTLHVGAGTFQPVKTADANEHVMHTEFISVPLETLRAIRANLGHIVAVGTTSMRTLESLYFLGVSLSDHVTQFEPYDNPFTMSAEEAFDRLIATGHDVHASTQIMIKPGYQFHVVDQLITNFHQPKSTLLLLVSAFLGLAPDGHECWQDVYRYALDHDFRFLSYGDSSILTRKQTIS